MIQEFAIIWFEIAKVWVVVKPDGMIRGDNCSFQQAKAAALSSYGGLAEDWAIVEDRRDLTRFQRRKS